ncbi:gastrula zinc finger protein XlCGF57.1-like [Thalassophryne amazonica]|uniref:gastrula zinc finger protein XlCGF57.1-like n=1 Tax=Thalassophryne amazonica TaxID=390379 RepID=UPI001471AA43|nr:gastrula zinc finger protein XlCGF57.1-like [Thalassophryne amazonica]
MSKVQILRALVTQRLNAAAEEIFGLFERTFAEYEAELCRSKEENHQQRHLLGTMVRTADVQRLLGNKEEVTSEWQPWCISLDQEDPEPSHMKEEQKEFWSSQGGGGDDPSKVPHSPVPVKTENDKETLQSSEHSTELEPARHSDPHDYFQPDTDDQTLNSVELETGRRTDVWKDTSGPQFVRKCLKNNEVPVSDRRYNTGEKPLSCSHCGKRFAYQNSLRKHMSSHTEEKPFSCSQCGKRFSYHNNLTHHMITHKEEKTFSCSECGKRFAYQNNLKKHIVTHGGQNTFSCSSCGMTFGKRTLLKSHMIVHTAEKKFSCSQCHTRFRHKYNLNSHMKIHTGEKPFSCPTCGKRFGRRSNLKAHMRCHNKPYSCSVCNQGFKKENDWRRHIVVHTGQTGF